jgi:hypothetical protein
VCDEGANLLGIVSGEGQPGDSTTTAAEHVGPVPADRVDEMSQILGLDLRRDLLCPIGGRAVAQTVWVVRHHGVVFSEQVRQRSERTTGHRLTDHQQKWPGSADLVVQTSIPDIQMV